MPCCLVRRFNHTPAREVISESDWDVLESLAHYNLWDQGYWLDRPRSLVDSWPLPNWSHRPIWGTELPDHCVSFSLFIHDLNYPLDLTVSWTDDTTTLAIDGDSNALALYYSPSEGFNAWVFIFVNNSLAFSQELSIPELAFLNVTITPDQDPGRSLEIFTRSLYAVDSGSRSSVHFC
jgi:hypothetical protein